MKNKLNTEVGESESPLEFAELKELPKLRQFASMVAANPCFTNAILAVTDAYREGWRARAELSGDSPRPQESKVSIARAAQLFRKLDACSSLSAKLILLRNFCERYAAELREAEAPRQPSSESTHDKTCEFCGQVEDPGICCEDSTAMIVEAEHSEPAKETGK